MKINLKLLGGLIGGLVLAMGSQVASAYSITYNAGNYTLCTTGTATGNPDFLAAATSCGGANTTEVYKQDVGGAETGSFAGSYSTAFFNTPGDPQDATITFTGGTSINCATAGCLLGIKDGKSTPSFYIFNISDWDGTSSIVMTGFWPDGGAISHVSLFTGGSSTSTSSTGGNVPAPASTLVLLGFGLMGIGFMRRRAHSA
jgi:hypothetical protein